MPPQIANSIDWPFPLGGVDENWAFSNQPNLTTPSASNVRGYSADQERARGGSRPGLKRAYSQQMGAGAAVQWLDWMDSGFGDTVLYSDLFEYTAGALNGNAAWSGDVELEVASGYVHLDAADGLPQANKSVTYQSFGGDDWEDFSFECGLSWAIGSTGSITMWVDSAGTGADGALVTVSWTSAWVGSPGLGFNSTFKISLTSGSNTDSYTRYFGPGLQLYRGGLRVEANKDTVEVYWDDESVCSCTRDDGTCDQAGFKMSLSNSGGTSPLSDGYMDFRLHDWYLTAITRSTTTTRKLVAVCNRNVWAESATEGTLETSAEDTDQLANVSIVSAAHCNGELFILDGTQPRVYRPMRSTNKVQNWSARKGELVKTCKIIVNWRNRTVLAGATVDPQNLYMSRVDDAYDFDYGMDDVESAVALNTSNLGRIGEPVQAMCPVNDDMLVIGCTKSVWTLLGDPMMGGRLLKASSATGILGQNAWTMDPVGNLYFFGEEGLYIMRPGGSAMNLSCMRIPDLSGYRPVLPGTSGASGQHYISLQYDADRHGLLLFLTPYTSGAATHYFYDLRTDAFWPETTYRDIGPIVSAYYNATTGTYRKLLLGGRRGYLFEYAEATKSDLVNSSTADGVPVKNNGTSTVTVDGAIFYAAMVGHSVVFTASGNDYPITAVGTTKICTVTGDASGEASGDTVTITAAVSSSVWLRPERLGGLRDDALITSVLGTLGTDSDAVTYGVYGADTIETVTSATAIATGTWSADRNIPDRSRVRGGAHAIKLSNATINRRWSLENALVEIAPGGRQR